MGLEWVEPLGASLSRLQTSPDGVSWGNRAVSIAPAEIIQDVAFGNGRFLAMTDAGAALTSTNGSDWVRVENAAQSGLAKLAFGNGLFVAVVRTYFQSDGVVAVSADGLAWNSSSAVFSPNFYPIRIAAGHGVFVVEDANTEPARALVSREGVNWGQTSMAAEAWMRTLTFGGG